MNVCRTLTAVFLLFAAATAAAQAPASTLPANRAIYVGDVAIDPNAGTLSATWRIQFNPDSTTTDSIAFELNRGLAVSRVTGDGKPTFAKSEDGFVVRFAERLKMGTPAAIYVAYSGTPVFAEDSINRINASWVELGLDGFWHPVFADFAHEITGSFRVSLPEPWMGAASGDVQRYEKSLQITNTVPLIDLAFTASPALRLMDGKSASVYYVNADSATVARVATTASRCGSYLNARYGTPQRMPDAKIVIAPRKGPGYARQNYIVITDVSTLPDEGLTRFLCHEFAHYWSSGAVSSGPENWLNEGLAEFVAARAVRDAFGAAAYEKILKQWEEQSAGQPPVWTPTSTARPSARAAYRKAPYLMHRFEERIGAEMMERVLQRYMTQRISTTPLLLAAVAEIAGAEHSAWLREELAR